MTFIISFLITSCTFKDNYKCKDCNVILISIDTLRADHLGVYGYTKNTTPNIDRFAKDSSVFLNTISQAPSTEPSHASIFTSLIPSKHGALFSKKTKLSDELVTFPKILKNKGYSTVSFHGGGQISSDYGFSQGFDIYEEIKEKNNNFEHNVKNATTWLQKNKNKKFFLFLHTFQVHLGYFLDHNYTYEFTKDYKGNLTEHTYINYINSVNANKIKANKEDTDYVISLYDSEIKSVDEAFNNLILFLKENNLYDNTIIIFTSDHGEEFGERHMIAYHSHTLYDELLKVPLIIKFPNSKYKNTITNKQVRSIDIFPTILDILSIPITVDIDGVSLLNLLENKAFNITAISERDINMINLPASLRTETWKLNINSLYNIEDDPDEKIDLSKDYPEIVSVYKELLDKEREENITPTKTQISEDTYEKLKSLGYI